MKLYQRKKIESEETVKNSCVTAINRREFHLLGVKALLGTTLFVMKNKAQQVFAKTQKLKTWLLRDPISKLNPVVSTAAFTGDEPDPNHERLWNVDGYIKQLGGVPQPTEQQDVVVIGGGLSGLISSYYLYKKDSRVKPLILEQSSQMGGNSKGEVFGNNLYSMGPAYISIPAIGSQAYRMLNEIGALRSAKIDSAEHKKVIFKGKVIANFWSGKHENPQIYQQFKNLLKAFELNLDQNIKVYNQVTMKVWLQNNFPQIQQAPLLLEYLEYYSWSSFVATLDEVAAGEFLSWQAAEQKGVLVFPGGNSFIAQALFVFLSKALGTSQLRTKTTVLKVIPQNGYVDIVVEESLNKIKTIRAKQVVMAVPKFVAKRIIANLPVEQLKAMDMIQYRSYIVGNVIFKRKFSSFGFDLYNLKGKIVLPSATKTMELGYTDIIFSDWAENDANSQTTLTVYKPFPYQGARQFLLSPFAHDKHKSFLLDELNIFLENQQIPSSEVHAVRMTLWGHAIPVCQAGFASSELLKKASQPLGNIYFVNQDNQISPSFEAVEYEAEKLVFGVRRKR
ncbi:MAG: FAD-dependent oxidoreductase [Bdellovibrionaceae bacterium]|nr:FAD-dependent oxidoreductase [Pseudobdellovibrionaceae bacterium]